MINPKTKMSKARNLSCIFLIAFVFNAFQLSAAGTSKKSYRCINVKKCNFIITDGARTNAFKLYGVLFPTKKTFKQFAKGSDVKAKDLTDFLPTINNELNKYAGRAVNIKKSFRKSLWLEDSNGNSINVEVVRSGLALPDKNVKRQYKKELNKAKCEAVKNAVGIWSLPVANDPTRAVRIECSSKNVKKTEENKSRGYSSFYTKDKLWKNTREINLTFDTFDLKRKIDLVIKYQFKISSYDGSYNKSNKRNITFSKIFEKEVSLYPPDPINIVIKSPEKKLRKHFDSDGREYSYLQGEDYAGEAVLIYYKGEVIFKRGELKE